METTPHITTYQGHDIVRSTPEAVQNSRVFTVEGHHFVSLRDAMDYCNDQFNKKTRQIARMKAAGGIVRADKYEVRKQSAASGDNLDNSGAGSDS